MREEIEVQDLGYVDKAYADRRVKHLKEQYPLCYVEAHSVKVAIPPAEPQYVPMPYPVIPPIPPSAVFTKEDPNVKLQVAYSAPRRVFKQPEPSLYDVVSGTWNAWREQQVTLGNLEAAAPEMPEVRALFEESPTGQLSLFPRDLPEPAR